MIYTRFLVGGSFVFASIVKIQGKRFTTESGQNSPIDSAWHLFEVLYQSGLYWQFIGWGQLIAGLLLMTQRYSRLGAILFLPVIGNIFVITLSYDFNYTPVITGGMLAAIMMLVAWEWDSLKVIVGKEPELPSADRLENESVWALTGLAIFMFTVIYRSTTHSYNLFLWVGVCVLIGLAGFAYRSLRLRFSSK